MKLVSAGIAERVALLVPNEESRLVGGSNSSVGSGFLGYFKCATYSPMGITCPDLRFSLKNGIDYHKERSSPRCKRLTSIPRHSHCREAGRKGELKSLDRGPPHRVPRWRRRWPASPVT